jgi:hypothetical protein
MLDMVIARLPSNQRMKLRWRGGRLKGKGSLLMAAAAPRSLCAIRWAAQTRLRPE